MMRTLKSIFILSVLALSLTSCHQKNSSESTAEIKTDSTRYFPMVSKYVEITLSADLSQLSDNQKKMISILIDAAKEMDELFWLQSYGNKDSLLNSIQDPLAKEFTIINYGPWDRLDGNKPFLDNFGDKPQGAGYYPTDMTKEEFESFESADKTSGYTVLRRNSEGKLMTVPFHQEYRSRLEKTSALLLEAASLADDSGLKNYLTLRSKALLDDDYKASDMAWLDMKNNTIDVVIGPIENYEDKLYGYKTAYEAYVLIKDKSWSEKLSKYAALLPALQKNIPVDAKYKKEKPGTDSDLNAYDVVYYAGDCNAGSKTIAINLPNDEEVQLEKGTRRLQLKNVMKAKFDNILVPISKELIADDQQKHITFEAFFAGTMFHEVAHGLGIKNTINGKGTAREALKELYGALEEGKADILGLYMLTQLREQGEYTEGSMEDDYVTFMAGIFRSIRFGAASAHGKANMLRFNFFKEAGAFSRDEQTGKYRVNFEKMKIATDALSAKILMIQGDGDYEGLQKWMNEKGKIFPDLQSDLDMLKAKNIPVDIKLLQGKQVLGL